MFESLKNYELPDYLLYTGTEGAKNWLKLDESEIFPVSRELRELLEENLDSIVRFIPAGMSFVSIGVGNGEKEKILLKKIVIKNLTETGIPEEISIFYYPVDISSGLIEIALEKVRDLPVGKKGIVGFIEDLSSLKKHWRLPILFSILGNTFCNYDPEYILKLVYDNLEEGDLFFFDANLFPASDPYEETSSATKQVLATKNILNTYASKENALFNMYPLLQYGMVPEDFDFELLLANTDSRIGKLYRTRKTLNILRGSSLKIGPNNINFKEGDVIRMGFTYKYTYGQILSFLDIYKFELLKAYSNQDMTNAIFLAKKRI